MARGKARCKESQHPTCAVYRPLVKRPPLIPPVHREALVTPQYTLIVPRNHQVMDDSTALRQSAWGAEGARRPSQANRSQTEDETTFQDWLSPWCQEPPDAENRDVETCCLGFWVPCALYGKSNWRLKRVAMGEDSSNASWKPSMGCNGNCWGWFGLCCLTAVVIPCCGPWCIAGIVTGMQRTRVRGTYGMQGKVVDDFCKGFWCSCCTQMQIDREIRAREGDKTLRYNKQYLASLQDTHIDTQPQPPELMSYAPSRQASEQAMELTQVTTKPKKLLKSPPAIVNRVDEVRVQISAPQPTRSRNGEPIRRGEPQQQAEKLKDAEEIIVSVDKKSRHDTKKDYGNAKQLRAKPHASVNDAEASKEPGKKANTSSSSAHENVAAIQEKSRHDRLLEEHTIVDCVEVETAMKDNKLEKQESRLLIDCTIVEVGDNKTSGMVEQHEMGDCHGASSSEDTQELSYVHDFTDCPVDKAVLDYYESQGTKVQQHSLSDDPRTSSSRGRYIEQHRLSEDTRVSSARGRYIEQHRLSEDTRASSSTAHQPPNASRQHTELECLELHQAGSSKTTGRQNRSASFGTDTTVTKSPNGLKEHRLVSCPPGFSVKSSSDDRSQDSDDNHASQKPDKKRLHASSRSKKQGNALHIHDENCLTGSLRHKCALNFEITSSKQAGDVDSSNSAGAATESKSGHGQKQRRFKGLRKTNDTKTSSGSNDNKSSRSAEKSGQSVHSQTSSQGGKKENSQNSRGGTSCKLVGFPYGEFEETKIIAGSSKSQGEQAKELVKIVVTEVEQESQDGKGSSFWSKMTGSTKGKEASSECHT
ncbi:uncharacterized protein LY89DRAFT_381682 [Mollisia scopiformis]|uniref:Uncharacterized protein n=1 Tax=Mollisia scopiformis TaxID=149040 RepID=A0A194XPQ7_MOLSC|nr:uncharacterized protein LY89DRAFT_381682 [Mollisia scopiformis]KUJ21727.1 hypothetical protein LY89DRAFT_381682 [Mollisia scopiformis]